MSPLLQCSRSCGLLGLSLTPIKSIYWTWVCRPSTDTWHQDRIHPTSNPNPKCEAKQVLGGAKNEGLVDPDANPNALGTKCCPIDHHDHGHPQWAEKKATPPVTRDREGPRWTPVSSGRRESLS